MTFHPKRNKFRTVAPKYLPKPYRVYNFNGKLNIKWDFMGCNKSYTRCFIIY